MKTTFGIIVLVLMIPFQTATAKRIKGINIPNKADLAIKVTQKVWDWLTDQANAPSILLNQPTSGTIWISVLNGSWGTWGGQLCSLYYHPSRSHTATTIGKLGKKISQAGPGDWAVSCQTRGLYGNQSYYNTL